MPQLIRFRRMLGLFAFFYGCLHFLTYFWLDKFFDFPEIVKDVAKRPFITVGFTAFVLLMPLAVTSTAGWIRRLGGKRWRALHRLVYVSAVGRRGALLLAGEVRRPSAAVLRRAGDAAAGMARGHGAEEDYTAPSDRRKTSGRRSGAVTGARRLTLYPLPPAAAMPACPLIAYSNPRTTR